MNVQTRRPVVTGVVLLVISTTLVAIGASASTPQPSPAPATNSETTQPASEVVSNATASEDDGDGNFSVPDPDHGVNASVFPRLWSGDVDGANATDSGSVHSDLLSVTDYAFRRPPRAVETWNAGDHQEFPQTNANRSVHPPHADLTDERWIRDAYIQVFAVQPSTVAHVAPNDTRHYIRPSGTVLATTDYRIGLPANETHQYDPPAPEPGAPALQKTTVTWQLLAHEMSNVTLEADGEQVATTGPSHTPRLSFDAIPGSTDRLTLSVTISATVVKTTRKTYKTATSDCDSRPIAGGNLTGNVTGCDAASGTVTTVEHNRLLLAVTVRDTIDVEMYELSPTATRATFTDGGEALAVTQNTGDPWAVYQLPSGDTVHNIWHFYAARNPHWDTLVESTMNGTTYRASDALPLQVHAVPSDGGVYARGASDRLEVTAIRGHRRAAPPMPSNISLPVVDDPYADGAVVVVRSDGAAALDGPGTVHGLVRGTYTRTAVRTTQRQRATTLTLELLGLNRSTGTATVRVSLRETATGQPIALRSRPGVVRIHGVTVEPNASGTAQVTVPLAGGAVTAEYEPAPWWATTPVYTASRASVAPPTDWPEPRRLTRVGVTLLGWLSPVLVAVYLIDRLLGIGRLWPPWRGYE